MCKKFSNREIRFSIFKTLSVLLFAVSSGTPALAQARLVTSFAADGVRVEFARDSLYEPDTVTITIIGDVMLHQAQIDNSYARFAATHENADSANSEHYDFSPYFSQIASLLQDADICVANMEFTCAGAPFSGYPAFCVPDSYPEYVADCGVDVFLTANNHILDKGREGIARTLELYENMRARGVSNTGCYATEDAFVKGHPLMTECRGVRIAIVNFTYGTNSDIEEDWPKVCLTDRDEIAEAMKKARENADIVIAIPHWGIEYQLLHSEEQEDVMNFLVRCGADAVIGAHPHVVQDVCIMRPFFKKIPVVYSMGNIISNMSAANTQIGLIVTLRAIRSSDGQTRVAEPEYTLTWCSLPGALTDSHITIPVKDFIGKRDEWQNPDDYDKMITTYNRIINTSGIKE